jgi:D-beta-D-heptose 7-phosphate kinase/D-beta-D-heptose 1-phosphate adenosyltransferase
MEKNKDKKEIVVAVSGGMDPLHIGHIRYLKEAKKLGDKLVVILNSDNFLIKKKGFVFMPYKERKEILENIKYVDEVFDCVDIDQSVCKSLAQLKPDIFAKGGDKTISNILEGKVCEDLGIKIVFGVGGEKIQSSGWLVNKLRNR